jgi:hypothetical protein
MRAKLSISGFTFGVALQTETNEALVIYRPLYENEYELFARSYTVFIELVEIDGKQVPRFEKIPSELE